MRVSERQRYAITNDRINLAKQDNVDALEVLSTQKKINALHDDPIGVTRAIKKRSQIDDLRMYQKNINFTKGFIETAETAISTINDRLIRAQELGLAMANDTYGAQSREATARELSEIINEVIQSANVSYSGRYVFSGFRTDQPPLARDGVFLGDDGSIFLQVEDQNFKQINIPGRFLFTPTEDERQTGHASLIDGLKTLRDGMKENNKDAIYKGIDELKFQMNKVSSFQASVGATWNAIDQAQQRLEARETREVEKLSLLEDADIFKATSNFKRTETVLQSTLQASNKLLQPSLLNFMQ